MSRRKLRLTGLIGALHHRYSGPIPAYRKVLEMAQNCVILAHQENGLWIVNESDIPAIAVELGLNSSACSLAGARRPPRTNRCRGMNFDGAHRRGP